MKLKIALLPGDGIGPEIVGEAVKVLDSVAAKYGHQFEYSKALVGACAIDATGRNARRVRSVGCGPVRCHRRSQIR